MCVNPARVICEACSRTSTASRACASWAPLCARPVRKRREQRVGDRPVFRPAHDRGPDRGDPSRLKIGPRRAEGFPYRSRATNKPSRSSWPASAEANSPRIWSPLRAAGISWRTTSRASRRMVRGARKTSNASWVACVMAHRRAVQIAEQFDYMPHGSSRRCFNRARSLHFRQLYTAAQQRPIMNRVETRARTPRTFAY